MPWVDAAFHYMRTYAFMGGDSLYSTTGADAWPDAQMIDFSAQLQNAATAFNP